MATGRIPTTANSPLTVKGDLFGYSTTQARVPVGNDGETLVADSSTSTGLSYQANFAAGKNKIINGDLRINQRNFTSNTADLSFNFDRFSQLNTGGGTLTTTPQVLTPATISGYGGTNYVRCVTASQSAVSDYAIYRNQIEDVRVSAGQTVTISFYAKAASGTPKIAVEVEQAFGLGGSGAVVTTINTITLSTSWARYTVTGAIPSVSGKTIAAGSYANVFFWLSAGSNFNSRTGSIGNQNNTFEMTGFQYEIGNTATAFQTATGTIQGELNLCYRYFQRIQDNSGGVDGYLGVAIAYGTTAAYTVMPFLGTFRTTPSTTFTSGNFEALTAAGASASLSSMGVQTPTTTLQLIGGTTSGLTSGQALLMRSGSAAYVLDISAEL
jgi:hypothetical protein